VGFLKKLQKNMSKAQMISDLMEIVNLGPLDPNSFERAAIGSIIAEYLSNGSIAMNEDANEFVLKNQGHTFTFKIIEKEMGRKYLSVESAGLDLEDHGVFKNELMPLLKISPQMLYQKKNDIRASHIQFVESRDRQILSIIRRAAEGQINADSPNAAVLANVIIDQIFLENRGKFRDINVGSELSDNGNILFCNIKADDDKIFSVILNQESMALKILRKAERGFVTVEEQDIAQLAKDLGISQQFFAKSEEIDQINLNLLRLRAEELEESDEEDKLPRIQQKISSIEQKLLRSRQSQLQDLLQQQSEGLGNDRLALEIEIEDYEQMRSELETRIEEQTRGVEALNRELDYQVFQEIVAGQAEQNKQEIIALAQLMRNSAETGTILNGGFRVKSGFENGSENGFIGFSVLDAEGTKKLYVAFDTGSGGSRVFKDQLGYMVEITHNPNLFNEVKGLGLFRDGEIEKCERGGQYLSQLPDLYARRPVQEVEQLLLEAHSQLAVTVEGLRLVGQNLIEAGLQLQKINTLEGRLFPIQQQLFEQRQAAEASWAQSDLPEDAPDNSLQHLYNFMSKISSKQDLSLKEGFDIKWVRENTLYYCAITDRNSTLLAVGQNTTTGELFAYGYNGDELASIGERGVELFDRVKKIGCFSDLEEEHLNILSIEAGIMKERQILGHQAEQTDQEPFSRSEEILVRVKGEREIESASASSSAPSSAPAIPSGASLVGQSQIRVILVQLGTAENKLRVVEGPYGDSREPNKDMIKGVLFDVIASAVVEFNRRFVEQISSDNLKKMINVQAGDDEVERQKLIKLSRYMQKGYEKVGIYSGRSREDGLKEGTVPGLSPASAFKALLGGDANLIQKLSGDILAANNPYVSASASSEPAKAVEDRLKSVEREVNAIKKPEAVHKY